MKRSHLMILSAIILSVFIAVGFFANPLAKLSSPPDPKSSQAENQKITNQGQVAPQNIKLLVGGDIVFHPITYSPQYETVVPPYSFSPMFARMQDLLEQADYSTITFEAACNPDLPYNGYPLFNTPPQAISELHELGFDAFATATNHILDAGGIDGLNKTFDEMDRVGVAHFGAHKAGQEAGLLTEIQGIQVAFLNYGEMYNGLEDSLSPEERALLSPLDEEQVIKDIQNAREDGADIVAVYPHWGVEYQVLPKPWQIDMARSFAEAGADLVIGSHPHVIQPTEWVENEGRRSFIAYSLGNAMSNQRTAFMGQSDSEIGAFLEISIKKDKEGARVEEVQVLPSTVYVRQASEGLIYEADLLSRLLDDPEIPAANKTHLQMLQARAEEILSQSL